MADSGEGDHFGAMETSSAIITTTSSSFSQLLFSDDDGDIVGLSNMCPAHSFDHHFSTCVKLPNTPRFEGFGVEYHFHHHQNNEVNDHDDNIIITCSDSSSANNNHNKNVIANTPTSKFNGRRNGSGQETVKYSTNTIAKSQRNSKKIKMENPTSSGHPKVRKEKLGERITALQQLVSPFGKTDTASVLHEAMGYIRFLHDQVQVLCSPYLQCQPEVEVNGEPIKNLKSRGLCLVPVDCTVHVASSNGADYWSPAMGKNCSSSPSVKQ